MKGTHTRIKAIRRHLENFSVHEGVHKKVVSYDLETILDYIEAHIFDSELTVEKLRRECTLRNHNISSRFKFYIGVGIQQYIEQRRIAAAKHLLLLGDDPIYHIAIAVGYSHHETFCRAFKRVQGCPPSTFRARVTCQPNSQNAPS